MSNPKIDKINSEIVRITSKVYEFTAKITELKEKLTDLEKQKIDIENAEIIALFRRENLNEDEFAVLLQEIKKSKAKDPTTNKNQPVLESEDDTDDSSDRSGTVLSDSDTDTESDTL